MSEKERNTTGLSGRNFAITATTTPTIISSRTGFDQSYERTTIEIFNEGAAEIYVYFKGSDPAAARRVPVDTSIAYAVTEDAILYVYTAAGTADVICTEIL